MDFTVTQIDFGKSSPKRVEVIARLSNNKTPVVYTEGVFLNKQQIVSLFKDYLSDGTTIKSVTLRADYVNDPIPKTKKKFANGGCVPCSRKMEDGGLLGEVDGMLPSSNSMSVIQPMAKGGKTYTKEEIDSFANDVNAYVYYTFNYYSPNHFDAFGSKDSSMYNHIKSKFSGYYNRFGANAFFNQFWVELDGGNQLKLATWIKENYKDSSMDRVTSTNQEFADNINQWVMFSFNYPHSSELDFMDAWSGSMKEHLGEKFSWYYDMVGSTGVMNYFYVNLDGGNQRLLSEWVLKNYPASNYAKGGMIKYYETDEDRDFGDSQTFFGMATDTDGMIKEAQRLYNREDYDAVEVVDENGESIIVFDSDSPKGERFAKGGSTYQGGGEVKVDYLSHIPDRDKEEVNFSENYDNLDEAIIQAKRKVNQKDEWGDTIKSFYIHSEEGEELYDYFYGNEKYYAKGGSTYSDGGSADSIGASVEVQVVDMLLENTGQHFLDSGGDKGRQWQRNQDKIFQDEPRVDYEVWNGEISDTVSAYHYLTEILDTDEYSYEVNQYLRSDVDEDGDACHWIEDCKERLQNSEEFSEIEWIGKMENTYNYENNLSQVFLSHIFKNPYTDEVYCLFQLHGGADVRGGYTTTRCFKLEGYLTGQVDVYGSVDGVEVTNSYNGYSLTTDDGEEVKATEDSEIDLDFQIYDDLPYEDGGRIPKQKMSYGGKAFKTPEAFVENLMDFSPYGALSQMFIIDAIGKYIDYTNSYTEEDIANDKGIIDAQTWVNTGKDIDGYMKSFYAHDGSYPNKRVKDNIGLIKDIMKNRGNDFFNRLYILEAINRQSKGVAEATDEQIQAFEDKGNTMVNMWGWRDTARNIQERIKEYNESKKEDGGYVGIDNSYESGDKGKYRYVLYDILDDGERVPLLDFYSDKENLHSDMAQSPVSVRESQEIVRDDNFFQVDKNITRSYFEDEPYYLKKGGKAKSDPQIVRYYFEDEPYEYGIGGFVLGSLAGGYLGYKVGRSRPQKKGFGTEKAVVNKMASAVKDVSSKKKRAKSYADGGETEKEYKVEVLIDEEIDLGTNVFAHSEDEAMDKAEELIRERNSEYEDSSIDIIEVTQINAEGGYVFLETDQFSEIKELEDEDEGRVRFLKNKNEALDVIKEFNEEFDTDYKSISEFNKGSGSERILTHKEFNEFKSDYYAGGGKVKAQCTHCGKKRTYKGQKYDLDDMACKVCKKENTLRAYEGGGSIENRNGEEYVIGIENLNGVVKNLQSKNNKVETLIDRKDIEIKEVSPKGFITNNGLVGWKYIDDRHTEKEGVMIFYDDFEKYFYFKLTDEERKNNPYGFDAEKRADIEDRFRDTEEEGYGFAEGGEIKASDLEEWDNKLDNGEDIVVIDNKGLDYMYQGSAYEKDAVAVMDSFRRLRGKHPETTYQMMPLSEIKEIKIETYAGGGAVKTSNQDSDQYTRNREPFNGSNLSGKIMPNKAYVVLSYGYYPLYVYKYHKWYENKEKYSVSTSKQQGQSRPTGSTIKKTTKQLKKLAGL